MRTLTIILTIITIQSFGQHKKLIGHVDIDGNWANVNYFFITDSININKPLILDNNHNFIVTDLNPGKYYIYASAMGKTVLADYFDISSNIDSIKTEFRHPSTSDKKIKCPIDHKDKVVKVYAGIGQSPDDVKQKRKWIGDCIGHPYINWYCFRHKVWL